MAVLSALLPSTMAFRGVTAFKLKQRQISLKRQRGHPRCRPGHVSPRMTKASHRPGRRPRPGRTLRQTPLRRFRSAGFPAP